MGEILKIHCRTCSAEWECATGCGLQHGRIENVIAAFEPGEQVQIIDWCHASPVPLYDFRYQIAVCDSCNSLVSVPVFKGINDDNNVLVGVCTTCHNQLKIPPIETEEIPDAACPSCGNKSLETTEIGHWD